MNTPIIPTYSAHPDSSQIVLGTRPLEVSRKHSSATGRGTAILRMQPDLTLVIDADFYALSDIAALSAGESVDLSFGADLEPLSAHVTELSFGSHDASILANATFLPSPQRIVSRAADDTKVERVVFHLVNFPVFLNSHGSNDLVVEKPNGGRHRIGRIILQEKRWKIEIQELPDTNATIARLKETGGHGITHVGQLSMKNGQPFSAKGAEKVIQNVHLFLSFARGAWTAPILSAGYDAFGSKIYDDWGVRMSTPWESRQSWFDTHHAESLPLLYSKFTSLLHHSGLGKAATYALYWYLRRNRGGNGAGVDSGIILSQAALERLSIAILTDAGAAPQKSASAADFLRAALLQIGIATTIPPELSALRICMENGLWRDGPQAIAKVRNELVHPKAKLPTKLGRVIPEAWTLAQWYIELTLLRLSGYNGCYSNRLAPRWVGEAETVPWALNPTSNRRVGKGA